MKHATPAQRLLGLRIHTTVFVPVVLGLIALNLWLGPPYWVAWVLLGRGVGLVAHWLSLRLSSRGPAGPP
jgi:hypothetical protein